MRHITALVGLAWLIGTAIACDQATSPTLIPFGGRATGGQNRQALQVFPDQVQLTVGQTAQLQTNAPLSMSSQLQWRSSNPNIATVTPAGRVTGVFPGVASITARFAFDTTQAATATVTVLGIP
jgi:uncharacterized protein YjdB